jgi:hypothetical protein
MIFLVCLIHKFNHQNHKTGSKPDFIFIKFASTIMYILLHSPFPLVFILATEFTENTEEIIPPNR